MTREQLIDKMVADVMEGFDFNKVHDVMVSLDWHWVNKNNESAVPSLYQLIKEAERLLRTAAAHYMEKEFYVTGSGGFMSVLWDGALTLQFVLAEYTAYEGDYINVKEEQQ